MAQHKNISKNIKEANKSQGKECVRCRKKIPRVKTEAHFKWHTLYSRYYIAEFEKNQKNLKKSIDI